MPNLHDLLGELPPGRRRVVAALVETGWARTYKGVAKELGLSVGTVYQHLRRVRRLHPEVYSALMAERACQLALRHAGAVMRAQAHSRAWYWKRINRQYYSSHGYWPWERPR